MKIWKGKAMARNEERYEKIAGHIVSIAHEAGLPVKGSEKLANALNEAEVWTVRGKPWTQQSLGNHITRDAAKGGPLSQLLKEGPRGPDTPSIRKHQTGSDSPSPTSEEPTPSPIRINQTGSDGQPDVVTRDELMTELNALREEIMSAMATGQKQSDVSERWQLVPTAPIEGKKLGGPDRKKIGITIDAVLFDRLHEERRDLNITMSTLIESIVWNHYGQPKLAFQIVSETSETTEGPPTGDDQDA